MSRRRWLGMLLAAMLLLSGCSKDPGGSLITESLPSRLTPEECKIAIFENGSPEGFWSRNDRGNGPPFDCRFSSDNARIADGLLQLWLTAEETGYVGAEYRTWNTFHYGYYSVSMQAVKCDGAISSFFLYTGRPWDEIDIEFLGNDTTKVQFNYYHNGKGGHEYLYDLGFDASKEFHTYGYRWTETSITWFVDGQPVYKVTTDKSATPAKNLVIVDVLPSTPGRILTNYWCGNQDAEGWMGKYQGQTKDNGTQYKWIATSAAGAPLNPEEKPNEEITGIDWNGISPIAPTFASTEIYTVTTNGTASNITYTGVGGSSYINVEMDIAEASADKNYVHLTVTNNGNEQVSVRVNMVDMALVEAGAQNMSTNIAATMDGTAVNTDAVWGGSFFDIPAGKTTELVIQFNGQVEKLQLMLDSSRNDANTYSGDITVDNIKFAKVGDIEIPEQPDDPVVPPVENPTSGDLTTTVDGVEVTWSGNVSDGYGLNADDASNTLRVTYTAIAGNSYKNFWATMTDIAATKNIFSMKVTNNGAAAVKIRIDIESKTQVNANNGTADTRVRFDIQATTQVGNHKVCNVSATGGDVWTDMEWGGSTVTVPAGQSVTLVITYDGNTERGAVADLVIFVDAARGDSETYNADITLSGMAFSNAGEEKPEEPKPVEGEYLNFKGNDCYSFDCAADAYVNTVRVTYTDVSRNTYLNVNTWIQDKAAGKNQISLQIKNNGTTTVVITVKVEDASATGLGEQTVTIAPGETVTVNLRYTGEASMLYFFIDTGWAETTVTNSGDVTISGILFTKAD